MSDAINHERAFDLLPWLANGTLEGDEHDRVERHVRGCLTCRAELIEQRAMQVLVREHPLVHLSAERSFEQLNLEQRFDRRFEQANFAQRRRLFRAPRLAAAAVACAAVGGAAWLGWMTFERNAPNYELLTTETQGSELRLDIIFSDGTTEEQMRALLAEVDGTIVGGPSALGRYTIRLDSTELKESDVDDLVRRLLTDDRVRFAGQAFMPGTPE